MFILYLFTQQHLVHNVSKFHEDCSSGLMRYEEVCINTTFPDTIQYDSLSLPHTEEYRASLKESKVCWQNKAFTDHLHTSHANYFYSHCVR